MHSDTDDGRRVTCIIIIIEITHQTRCIHVDIQIRITIIKVNYRVQAWCKSVSSSQGRNPGTKTELFNSLIKERWQHLEQNSVLQTDNRTSYCTQQSSYNYSKQQNKQKIITLHSNIVHTKAVSHMLCTFQAVSWQLDD